MSDIIKVFVEEDASSSQRRVVYHFVAKDFHAVAGLGMAVPEAARALRDMLVSELDKVTRTIEGHYSID